MREELAVEDIETIGIDSETLEYRFALRLLLDRLSDRRVVPQDLHVAIGDTRCPTRALGDREDGSWRDLLVSEDFERSRYDLREIGSIVEIKLQDISEAISSVSCLTC